MARKGETSDIKQAFQLFLDTATNSFGGIIFIVLLVCILLELTGTAVKQTEKSVGEEADKNAMGAIEAEIGRLRDVRNLQLLQLKTMKAADPRILQQYLAMEKKKEDARKEQDRVVAQLGKIEADMETVMNRVRELLRDQVAFTLKLERLTNTCRELGKNDPQSKRLAKVTVVNPGKALQVPVLLSNKRMVYFYKYDAKGKTTARNEDDIALIKKDTEEFVEPKANCGTLVEKAASFKANFANEIDKFDKGVHIFTFAVWPDSYEEFEILRDILIQKNYNYGLIIIKKGAGVPLVSERKPIIKM